MRAIKRVYVEKKKGFAVEAEGLFADLRNNLGISSLLGVRIVNRYDIAGITDEEFKQARNIIFAEPPVDDVNEEVINYPPGSKVFALEYLPGQYDQRADSAAQCIQIITQKERPRVLSAKVIILEGNITPQEFVEIKSYCINPVESREASLEKPQTLELETELPDRVEVLIDFINKDNSELKQFLTDYGLAMSLEDLLFCQAYFRDTEKRNPTIAEIRVIDTYWSDHCRHTTFQTEIESVQFEAGQFVEPIKLGYNAYLEAREHIYSNKLQDKDICLMDIAVIGMKELRREGKLDDLDESDEINACSIVVNADIDGANQEWLVMFKNETHNHPTEIEPFGGAATCLGGAIRDPLSGRTYVYQAMRVTGSGDPRARIEETLPGKLPQRKITTQAAAGYSSYGNQIGLSTGQVAEVYDPGFVAKRMEIGAVIAAAPRENVVREQPVEGDVILLVGGRTGRDGCGGATGSSKEHNLDSLEVCGAEVQKGNPPNERKIQRLFRNPEVSTLIKRCNDFGAGGISVAIGELTDGLEVDLDAVPKKYDGLDGTELAISESQERMAVVVASSDADKFAAYAAGENLEAIKVARVTSDHRLKMFWRSQTIIDISRDFLNTNGVKQKTRITVQAPNEKSDYFNSFSDIKSDRNIDLKQTWLTVLADLNICGKKGLVERFDSTIGAGTVLMPFGGKYQLTPAEGMAAKLPVQNGETNTATLMSYGYNPQLAKWSPFHGGLYAVVEAVAKVVAMGGNYTRTRLTLQEYFEKLGSDPLKWGKPFSALLGAYQAQKVLGVPAIGGKDSMSGTFLELNVPPTLVAFAVNVSDARSVISQEFKQPGNPVVIVRVPRFADGMPDFEIMKRNFSQIHTLINNGKVLAARTVRIGGVAAAVSEMAFGNLIGFKFSTLILENILFEPEYGSIILELEKSTDLDTVFAGIEYELLGKTTVEESICINGSEIMLSEALRVWENSLEDVFPSKTSSTTQPQKICHDSRNLFRPLVKIAKPRVFIPVFPGTNCEYDSIRAFEKAGGVVQTTVVRNLTASDVEQSIEELVRQISNAQIVMLPGGFSAGDEPEGSGKFIAAMFRNPRIKEAVTSLLKQRDGLMLGVCNGFQALVKLGLVPYGEIVDLTPESPTLTFNKIGRHVSCLIQTKLVSSLSPWFSGIELGHVHTVAVSHGEGRFVAPKKVMDRLISNGQVATQYVDHAGNPSNDIAFNPNGSYEAIEGITSPDGRVLGKMGHSERTGTNVHINVPGDKYQPIFVGGINYFR